MWIVELWRGGRSTMLSQILPGLNDVVRQRVHQRVIQVRPDDDAQTIHFLRIRRHRVGGKYPAALAYLCRNKASFLELVQRDRYVDRYEQRCFDRPHSLEDLPTLRPLAYVFPKEYMKRIIAMATVTAEETDDGNGSNN